MRWNRILTVGVVIALLISILGCDGTVRARFKVLSADGMPLDDTLVRLETTGEHDLASFTGESGCTDFGGTVSPYSRHVTVNIQKAGYQPITLEVPTGEFNCFLVYLAPIDTDSDSHFERLETIECPCAPDGGYPPTMTARFKVRAKDGTPLEMVEVRRSDQPPHSFAQVTNDDGCLGVSWIVPAYLSNVPLALEKSGYQPAYVEVPILEDRCYTVILSPIDDAAPSEVTPTSNINCECEMFSGRNVNRKQ